MKIKELLIILITAVLLTCCNSPKDQNYLGYVKVLPKGEYVIYNRGSRHIVRCVRADGKYYNLNDGSFRRNGIKGHDAHQYRNKTRVIIK